MEFIKTVFYYLNEIARPILLLLASGFTIYFASSKIGRRVIASYVSGSEKFSMERILSVTLSNRKDKPISVHAIYASFEGEIWLELDRYDPPIILKPFECIGLKTPEYSELTLDDDRYRPKLFSSHVELYIETESDTFKCEMLPYKKSVSHLKTAYSSSNKFGNFVYDDSVKYIFNYVLNEETKVAFITEGGYIGNEWDFKYNHLGEDFTDDSLREFLLKSGVENMVNKYICYKVEGPFPKRLFAKNA